MITPLADDSVVKDIANLVTASKRDAKQTCVLFLGAGIHAPPPDDSPVEYPEAQRPPLGGALSEQLSKDCGCNPARPDHDPWDLQRASLCYEIRRGRNELIRQVQDAVSARTSPSPALLELAELPFPLVVTTNYDDLFEQALRKKGKRPIVTVYNPQRGITKVTKDWSVERPWILKLHGDFTDPASIVLTDEDYIQFILRMRDPDLFDPVPQTFKLYLTMGMTLFLGYSLRDYNLRLLFRTVRVGLDDSQVPTSYSIDVRPDRLIRDIWENRRRHITFLVQNHWDFIPRLNEQVTSAEQSS